MNILGVLEDIVREIGTLSVPSRKGEIDFRVIDDELWVSYKEHNPDGTYTDVDLYKFKLNAN